jgi:Na+/H+-dicarboxylate symporter
LATIPLAVRSAMVSGTTSEIVRSLVIWLGITIAVVALVGVLVPSAIFHFMPADDRTISVIGKFVSVSTDRVDINFSINAGSAANAKAVIENSLLAVVPTNIFASLASNDSLRVLVFATVFGIGMVTSERRSGFSAFEALRHVHDVCLLIFDWFNILMPIGIVALIAPQVASIGSEVYAVLQLFTYAFLTTSLLILGCAILTVAAAIRVNPRTVLKSLLRPMMLGAASRNTLVCIPLTLEIMTDELRMPRGPCELYIPVGFATLRFGTILYFCVTTLFMGTLLGRTFGLIDVIYIAVLSVVASFATLGVTGIAGLAPLATVLRPFGLSFELAVPLMVIVDPIVNMIRVMLNVAVNCVIPALATGRQLPVSDPELVPAE